MIYEDMILQNERMQLLFNNSLEKKVAKINFL